LTPKTAAHIFAALLLAVCLGCTRPNVAAKPEVAHDATAAEPMRAPFVETMLFGYWAGEPFTTPWVEATNIPLRPGLYFGWRIKLRAPHGKFAQVVERVTAPRPPATWGPLEKRRMVSADRSVATSPSTLRVRDDWIDRSNWMISEGDPAGAYQIEMQVNGRMAARLTFHLIKDLPPPANPENENGEIEDEIPDAPDVSPAPEPPATEAP
jgi:hypothetical protein